MNVAVFGATGKAGQEILKILLKDARVDKVFGIVHTTPPPKIGGVIFKRLKDLENETVDGVIDFSSPACAKTVSEFARKKNAALVVGTTGYGEKEESELTRAARFIPVLCSGNFSKGVRETVKIVEDLSRTYPNATVEIYERHHANKKDAPSGTAKILKTAVEKNGGSVKNILSSRAGSDVGTHAVVFSLYGESLTVIHHAESRAVFAVGAVDALFSLIQKPCGRYSYF